ncbi:TIGR00153 family protein [Pseudomaricurvus alkylphenolicus]|jgi:predicted phosphate transport protein (TIGR00153 family)|uniref:TIGR00153 family protein n=1 Tax=Pseudomaricurvus alkylphenolicus TaxID=1306991 RepID=UPI001422D2E1|nr:TIGR00153 family protein [Pseudomaricurvus alkylphenolicus]NIB42845.1 TIGR00153 family protein [Pseudomaricurvus alkylphenolicus]
MAISNPFGNLFGKSPIKPIQEHMAVAHQTAEQLPGFFQAANKGDWTAAAEIQQRISELENHADELKKEIRLHLPKSLFLPVPRSDLLELLSMQDKIANRAKDIAGIMLGREMAIPKAIETDMTAFVDATLATTAQALKAINELDELLETGFSGRELQLVEKLIEELDRLEHQTDQLQINIRAELFKVEKELPPVDVMFIYRVIEWVGDVADRAQKVGSRLQMLLAR